MCDPNDPFTMAFPLCEGGTVRRGAMWEGTDYPCTSHAHYGGEHIQCTDPSHEQDHLRFRTLKAVSDD